MEQINIGIMGLGTIGFGVFKILSEELQQLNKKYDLNINLHSVASPEIDELKEKIPDTIKKYKDGNDIINDPDIHIVIELIGGTGIAKDLVINAIKNKKHVITANKAIISEFGKEIFKLANENNVTVSYEAAVGGVMPIISTVKHYLASNEIIKMKGILNGTSNFILTMMDRGLSYEEAVKKAQDKGFAEADPTLDVNGADPAHKITILARLAFGMDVTFKDIFYEGIQNLTKIDFDFAKENGYKIKLLAIAKKNNGKYEISVRPVLIDKDHMLAKVDYENNAFYVEGNYSDPILIVGKGAGRFPTATAVVNDVINTVKTVVHGPIEKTPELENMGDMLTPFEEVETGGYIRISSVDKPGVLAKEAKLIGDNNLNIVEFSQKVKYKEENYIPDLIIIDKTKYKKIKSTIEGLKKLDCVKGEPFFLGISE